MYHKPTFINHVTDRTGTVIYNGLDPGRRVFSEQVAAEADIALRAVVQYGTGTAASLYNREVAGKTGTTNNNVDAWFNGFTPQLETTVWIGNEKAEIPIYIYGAPVYGADYPARTWHDYTNMALAPVPAVPLPQVASYLLPATHYISSPSLVADDVLDHNGAYYSGYNGNPYGGSNGYNPGSGSPPSTAYSPPATSPPATSAPVTSPPATTPPVTSPPPTTAPPAAGPAGRTGRKP